MTEQPEPEETVRERLMVTLARYFDDPTERADYINRLFETESLPYKELGLARKPFLQRGEAWLRWRNEGIGSSDVGRLVLGDKWPYQSPDLFTEKVEGTVQPSNYAMKRGKRLEPEAIHLAALRLGIDLGGVCVESLARPYCRASLDAIGSTIDGQIIIVEAKCLNAETHLKTIRSNVIPYWYVPQLGYIWELFGGKARIFYASYANGRGISKMQRFGLVEWRPEPNTLPIIPQVESFWNRILLARKDRNAEKR